MQGWSLTYLPTKILPLSNFLDKLKGSPVTGTRRAEEPSAFARRACPAGRDACADGWFRAGNRWSACCAGCAPPAGDVAEHCSRAPSGDDRWERDTTSWPGGVREPATDEDAGRSPAGFVATPLQRASGWP